MNFRKIFMPLLIGHTRLILYAAYQCMGLQSGISLVRKLMQQDLCVSCLVTWSREFLCSSVGYASLALNKFWPKTFQYFRGPMCLPCDFYCSSLMKLATKLKEMSVMCGRWGFYLTSQGNPDLMVLAYVVLGLLASFSVKIRVNIRIKCPFRINLL